MKITSMIAAGQTWMAFGGYVLAQGGGQAEGQQGGGWVMFLPLVVMIVFWYLLIIRPQQKERGKRQEMLKALKKNDRVITTSGMLGTVANISQDGNEITLKFGDSTRIPFLRSAIETVVNGEAAEANATAKT